jgi:hypothetical protein
MKIVTGSLEEGKLAVLLDGKPLSTTKVNRFTINQMHTLKLTTTVEDGYFRGFLFRLGDPDAIPDPSALAVPGDAATHLDLNTTIVSYILPTDELESQLAASCLLHNASGISHTSASLKTEVSATLNMNHASSKLRLDVTVVVHNRNHVSEFYYSGYDMHAAALSLPLWQTILFFIFVLSGTVTIITIIVRIVTRKLKRQGKTKYHELAGVKMAEEGEVANESHIDTTDTNEDEHMVDPEFTIE